MPKGTKSGKCPTCGRPWAGAPKAKPTRGGGGGFEGGISGGPGGRGRGRGRGAGKGGVGEGPSTNR